MCIRDSSKASNFERFVFDLLGRDGAVTHDLFKTKLEQTGHFTLTPEQFERIAVYGFQSGHSTHADRLATIRDTFERFGTMIDTHTADGLKVAHELLEPGGPAGGTRWHRAAAQALRSPPGRRRAGQAFHRGPRLTAR